MDRGSLAGAVSAAADASAVCVSTRRFRPELPTSTGGGGETPPASGLGLNPIARDPELLNDIIWKSRLLASVENELMNIERSDQEALHSVFRSFHNDQKTCGFLELVEIQEVADQVEWMRRETASLGIMLDIRDIVLEGKDDLERSFQQLSVLFQALESR